MSFFEFSPGPWKIDQATGLTVRRVFRFTKIAPVRGETICVFPRLLSQHKDPDIWRHRHRIVCANARLIAQSPTMYLALQEIIKISESADTRTWGQIEMIASDAIKMCKNL